MAGYGMRKQGSGQMTNLEKEVLKAQEVQLKPFERGYSGQSSDLEIMYNKNGKHSGRG
tara:strand:+ start:348 stop:521 length:174 start_codon:yes stop_codon:yes gene_type:complete